MKLKYLTILLAMLFSCDNSFDELDSVNEAPEISFDENTTIVKLADSVKLSTKLSIFEYEGKVWLSDIDQGVYAIKYAFENNEGEFFVDGEKLSENQPFVVSDKSSVNYRVKPNSGFGIYKINIVVIDKLGREGNALLELTAYENNPPVAHFSVTKLGVNSELEYEFDARESYDRDGYRGGGVENYQYYINDQPLPLTNQSVITWYFSKAGGYRVRLKVQDSDGAWSPEEEIIVQVGG